MKSYAEIRSVATMRTCSSPTAYISRTLPDAMCWSASPARLLIAATLPAESAVPGNVEGRRFPADRRPSTISCSVDEDSRHHCVGSAKVGHIERDGVAARRDGHVDPDPQPVPEVRRRSGADRAGEVAHGDAL